MGNAGYTTIYAVDPGTGAVVAAGSRSAVQLAEQVSTAHVLSAAAGMVYLIGLALVVRVDRTGRGVRPARAWCLAELAAVIAVGTWTVVAPLGQDAVWTDYGRGYGFVPAALPIVGLCWLGSDRVTAAHKREQCS